MKCLIIDDVHSSISEELSRFMQVDMYMLPTQKQLTEMIPDYDILIMRVDPMINETVLAAAKKLKAIGVCSVGLNHIDLDAAKARNIAVFNAPGMNANAVAELTISKMLDLSRHTMEANEDVKVNHRWNKYKFVGSELRGKTLGIMGFGRIGQRVGELAYAFGMKIVACDRHPHPASSYEQKHAVSMDKDNLLRACDFVSIHMPMTAETRNMINAKTISEMKPGAVILNMSRGGIVNEQDVYEALKSGRLGGYACDVMEDELVGSGLTEDATFDSPLFECENFIVTPHLGAQTKDASREIGEFIVNKLEEALNLKSDRCAAC